MVLLLGPLQYWPPYRGAGLLHALLAKLSPSPQVTEQGPGEDHAPQLPSTVDTANQKECEVAAEGPGSSALGAGLTCTVWKVAAGLGVGGVPRTWVAGGHSVVGGGGA